MIRYIFLTLLILSGCDSIGSSSSGAGLIINGPPEFQAKVEKAIKIYRPHCVYLIKPSKGRFSFYTDGVAYMDAGIDDIDIFAGKIAHEDYHCKDKTRMKKGQSSDEFRVERELRAFKYEAEVYKTIGRGDLAGHVLGLDGRHCLNITPKYLF